MILHSAKGCGNRTPVHSANGGAAAQCMRVRKTLRCAQCKRWCGTVVAMCRSIKQLRDGATPAPSEEVEAAALQFVRKISGFRQPASHNQEVFNSAVADIARISEDLLEGLEIRGSRKSA